MSAAFSRSTTLLRAGDQRSSLVALAVAVALLGAWLGWALLARVTRYEVSDAARIEVGQTASRVAAPVAGRVVAVRLSLGAEVEAGDVLVELEDLPLRLELDEQRARLAAAEAQAPPLRREIEAHERAASATAQAGHSRIGEARAHADEAEVTARFHDVQAARADTLYDAGVLPAAEREQLAAEALAGRAGASARQRATRRTAAEQRSRSSEQRAELAGLERQATALDGDIAVLRAAITRLHGEIERRKVRAAVAGRLGEIAVLRAGAFLAEGDAIAAIVPVGELHVVAQFPLAAIGRLRVGQPGRLRLAAYPWTEYGTVPVLVRRIGTEAQDGRVRVELAVLPVQGSPIALEHGLLGSALVEVEQVSPATLLLRAAGQLVGAGKAVSP